MLALFLLLSKALVLISADDCDISDDKRVDCGYYGINQDLCENQNHCCWVPAEENSNGVPWCFHPKINPNHTTTTSTTSTSSTTSTFSTTSTTPNPSGCPLPTCQTFQNNACQGNFKPFFETWQQIF